MKGVLWEYDFQNVVTLSSVVYGFVCIAPMAVWILFRQLEIQINLLPIICLYGYSLFVYIPAAVSALSVFHYKFD